MEKQTEEQKSEQVINQIMMINPGIAAAFKIRKFIEGYITYKIDMLPMLDGVKDKMEQEFQDLIIKNFRGESNENKS